MRAVATMHALHCKHTLCMCVLQLWARTVVALVLVLYRLRRLGVPVVTLRVVLGLACAHQAALMILWMRLWSVAFCLHTLQVNSSFLC